MRSVCLSLVCIVTVFLGGCAVFSDPNAWPQSFKFGGDPILAMGPDLRTVSERQRPMRGDGFLPTVCTEPSPDVAIAFGHSLSAQASVSEPNKFSGSGQLSASTTEQATALAGRTAGVLALRDGLFAACQAYTNGVLGQDAYAMVLSQYGNLLVALAGPSSGAGAEQAYTPYTPQDVALATLLVGCISEYDPTRLGALGVNGRPIPNPMLSRAFCRSLLTKVANGKPLTPPKGKKAPTVSTDTKAQAGQASQSVVIKVTGPSSGGDSGAIAPAAAGATAQPASPTKPPAAAAPAPGAVAPPGN
jgi:hypothetical protein